VAVLRRHALPNAFIPVIPMVAMDISRFALPTALFIRNDLPVIVGVVVVTALVIAIVNFVGELIQAAIDPRVKLQPAPA
jgi:peptide/nickel transport system permease protein